MTTDATRRELIEASEEIDAEIFLIEETILLSPISEEDEIRLRAKLSELRMQLDNTRLYISQLNS